MELESSPARCPPPGLRPRRPPQELSHPDAAPPRTTEEPLRQTVVPRRTGVDRGTRPPLPEDRLVLHQESKGGGGGQVPAEAGCDERGERERERQQEDRDRRRDQEDRDRRRDQEDRDRRRDQEDRDRRRDQEDRDRRRDQEDRDRRRDQEDRDRRRDQEDRDRRRDQEDSRRADREEEGRGQKMNC
ncbi:unnamed protein product [Arctogadus glacialis]